VAGDPDEFDRLLETMRKAAAALRDAGVPHALAGGLAIWARGGPRTEHDVDFLVLPEDAESAQQALVGAGMRADDPPEQWLLKAYDGDNLVDLIFSPSGGPVTQEWLDRAEELEVMAIRMPVASLEDVLVTKLLSISEQDPDMAPALEIARSVREQIDWDALRARVEHSPFAKAFLVLVEELGVAPAASSRT
jgi:putative nucleotidyltransferase-like protein